MTFRHKAPIESFQVDVGIAEAGLVREVVAIMFHDEACAPGTQKAIIRHIHYRRVEVASVVVLLIASLALCTRWPKYLRLTMGAK